MFRTTLAAVLLMSASSICFADAPDREKFAGYVLDFTTPVDAKLQKQLVHVDATVRERIGMTGENTAGGVLDLSGAAPRLAMLNPDRETYAASVPKIGILLA